MSIYPPGPPGDARDLLTTMGAPDHLIIHCAGVAAVARKLAGLAHADEQVCYDAALLHDIGKAPGTIPHLLDGRHGADLRQLQGLDHAALGGMLLRASQPRFAALAPILERHAINAVLEQPPVAVEEQVVFLADKLFGLRWLGLHNRLADLERRYGSDYPIRLCMPGTYAIALILAARACLSWPQVEALLRPTDPERVWLP